MGLARYSRNYTGWLVIGALEDIKPILLKEGDDECEAMAVQVKVNQLEVRLVVGYGACESDRQAKKLDTTQKKENLNYGITWKLKSQRLRILVKVLLFK